MDSTTPRFVYAALLVLSVSLANETGAAEPPLPPCDSMVRPEIAGKDRPATVKVWHRDEISSLWRAPDCLGWEEADFVALIAVTGRFEGTRQAQMLLRQMGAISERKRIRYWSRSRKTWRLLFDEAYALTGNNQQGMREDFSVAELTAGKEVFFWLKENNPATGMVFRMRILERQTNRIVTAEANVTASRTMFGRVLGEGDLETTVFLQRGRGGDWRYYSLSRLGAASRDATETETGSLVNRLVAGYRFLAGIPTAREPAAAR